MPSISLPASDAGEIQRELVAALYDQTRSSVVAAIVVAIVFSTLLLGHVAGAAIATWLAAACLASGSRLVLWWQHHRSGEIARTSVARWRRWHIAVMVLPGAVWGAGGAFFFGQVEPLHQTLVVFVLGGLSVASIPYLAPVFAAYAAYVLPLLLPLQVMLLVDGVRVQAGMAAMLFVFTVLLLLSAYHYRGKLVDSLALRHKNQALVDELEVYRARLEHQVHELEFVNHELESFNYSVSHDLRSPLLAINGYSSVLQEDHAATLNDEAMSALQRIRAASLRMGDVIDALLQLSRISRQTMDLENADLSVICAGIAQRLAASEPERDCELVVQPRLSVYADPGLLSILMENLLSNAWKYTRSRERTRIEVGSAADKGDPVFFVRDNGLGFDMRYADRLFKAFERLHGEAEYEGSGIGLATVARIVRRHRGSIWAEAAPGQGATFYFVFHNAPPPPEPPRNGLT